MSPNTLKDAITVIDLAKREKGEESNESATTFATGNGNNINPSVQTPKLVAKATSVSESTVGVSNSHTTSALKKCRLFTDSTDAIIGRFKPKNKKKDLINNQFHSQRQEWSLPET